MRLLGGCGAGIRLHVSCGCALLLFFGCGGSGEPAGGPGGAGGAGKGGQGGVTAATLATGGATGTGGISDMAGRSGGDGGVASGGGGGIFAGGAGGGSDAGGGRDGGIAGRSGSGGVGTGGASGGAGGGVNTGGRVGTGGVTGGGGSGGRGGGGGGGAGSGGTVGAGGTVGTGGLSAGGATGACGVGVQNQHPFGCKFAWGIADPGGSLAGFSYLQFVSYWVDSSISASGTYTSCGGCRWLTNNVAPTNLIPAYYAYIIGFLAHANGIVDGNQTGAKKLTTDGAALVKSKYDAIIDAYAWYARETAKAWPNKPLVWLLEGDFVQFADKGQSTPLTYAEVGKLAADVACAIKTNMPNAVVAINHSSWNANEVTQSYWGAMKDVDYDMVWTTGVGNNKGFIEAGASSTTYNAATATYAYLHGATGRTILVDTSAGISSASDSWSTASASDLNARIAEGVIAANITGTRPTGLSDNLAKLANLDALPSCP
ncbi:MAG: hypothetical protein JXP73_07755 [Deltaproteobacteria bacterium]|nr:hypothetical protein [Deltaproteobacteria bacterium]